MKTISILIITEELLKLINVIVPDIYINTTEISKGVYFLKLITENNSTYKSLVKR